MSTFKKRGERKAMSLNDEMKLVNKLKEKDKNLYEYVGKNCKAVVSKLNRISDIFEEYTDHSENHSKRIVELGAELLGNENDLSKWEIATFILAAYYHDAGMDYSKESFVRLVEEDAFKRKRESLKRTVVSQEQLNPENQEVIDRFIKLEYIRRNHAEKSAKYILKEFPKTENSSFFGGHYLWEAVANASKAHTLSTEELKQEEFFDNNFSIGNGITIDLAYLICLLRLSDICHFGQDRALPFMRKSIDFYSKKSQKIWKKTGDVADTKPISDKSYIRVQATCTEPSIHRAIIENAEAIEEELMKEHKLLGESDSNKSHPWRFVDTSKVTESHHVDYQYFDAKFKLNFDKIAELLMGDRLYQDKLMALREAIQNSLDAITAYQLKNPSQEGYISIQYKTIEDTPVMDVFDNGTGMDKKIFANNLLAIGSNPFWETPRFLEEWGRNGNEVQFIASHGIGFLSLFMIAKRVEVFSKYRDQEPIHIDLDSYKRRVVQKDTNIQSFPSWQSEKIDFVDPWRQGHGTCVRLHLKENISRVELVNFLSEYILRPSKSITFSYNKEAADLPEKWNYGSLTINDRNIDENKKNESLEELVKEAFGAPDSGFYVNPPNDGAIQVDKFIRESMEGKLRLKAGSYSGSYSESRVSQKGILVNQGYEFINDSTLLGDKDPERYQSSLPRSKRTYQNPLPFTFDVDLTGDYCLELNAERTKFLNNKHNKEIRKKIVDDLLEEFFSTIEKIDSSLYFPCGNKYYHGAESILNSTIMDQEQFSNHPLGRAQEPDICFHEPLRDFLSVEKFKSLKDDYSLDSIEKAKIYTKITEGRRNVPISVQEIKNQIKSSLVFLPTVLQFNHENHLLPEEDREQTDRKFDELKDYNQVEELKDLTAREESIIILPNFPESFILPLVRNFDFEVLEKTLTYLLLKPEIKKERNIEEVDLKDFRRFAEITEQEATQYLEDSNT